MIRALAWVAVGVSVSWAEPPPEAVQRAEAAAQAVEAARLEAESSDRAVTAAERKLVGVQAELEAEKAKRAAVAQGPEARIAELETQVADLKVRQQKMKKEVDDASDLMRTDLREALNVIEGALFKANFDLKKARKQYQDEVQPKLDAHDARIRRLEKAVETAEGALASAQKARKAARSAEAKARKAKQEADRELARLKKRPPPEPAFEERLAASAVASPIAKTTAAKSTGPYQAEPPGNLQVPPAPAHLSPDAAEAFERFWRQACWFASEPGSGSVRARQAVEAAAAAALPEAAAADKAGETGPKVQALQEAARALESAWLACRYGRLGGAPVALWNHTLATVREGKQGRIERDFWVETASRWLHDVRTVVWTGGLKGCEPWVGPLEVPRSPSAVAFEEWKAASRVPTPELKKVVDKLEKEQPGHPNLALYRRILDERSAATN